MQRQLFQTALGTVTLSGATAAFEGPKPLIVVLRGIFASEHQYSKLPDLLPEARVLYGDTYGDSGPRMAAPSIGAYCAAYSQAISSLPGPTVVCGVSLGGVVALGLRCPGLLGVLSLDPPMRPGEAPHLIASLTRRAITADQELLWNVFGIGPAGEEPRDYFPVLDRLTHRAIVFAGGVGRTGHLAGVISDDSLERLSRHPMVLAERVPGVGHDISRGGSDRVIRALRWLIATAPPGPPSFA